MEISLVPALIHVYIFILESVLWGSAKTNKVFSVKAQDVAAIKPWAFNQGFYNLFLAGGIFLGIYLRQTDATAFAGTILELYVLGFMVLAGLVLVLTMRKKWPAALVQAGPALVAIYFLLREF